MLPECRHVLHQMKLLRPQYELDGYHNVWIFKPGAKSRGRGIAIITLHHLLLFFCLLPRCMECRCGLALRILSVCLSVRQTCEF